MPAVLNIQFDNPYATFYTGQSVTGRVILSTDKPKKIRAITVNFKGAAEVQWTVTKSRKDADGKSQDYTTTVSGNETYFENKYYLVGGASGELELAQGSHSYPFQCQLPHTLPSSFEGEYGHIRYTVKATMDRPWKFDQDTKAAFTVVAPLDLNTLPQAKEPVLFEKSKNFCCLWCKSGPLILTVKLPAGGYVPGQVIPFEIDIENGSNIRVHPINVVLRKEVTWHARNDGETKETKTPLADLAVDEEVKPHDSKSFSKDITVPAVPPSNLANCGIIDLSYILKIEAVVGGCHSNVNARIPIVMGTIPLLTGPTAYKPSAATVGPVSPPFNPVPPPAEPNGQPAPPAPGGGWSVPSISGSGDGTSLSPAGFVPTAPPLYPELPPPSYEESIFKGNNIKDSGDNEHTTGIQDFTPRYPVWTFDTINQQK